MVWQDRDGDERCDELRRSDRGGRERRSNGPACPRFTRPMCARSAHPNWCPQVSPADLRVICRIRPGVGAERRKISW